MSLRLFVRSASTRLGLPAGVLALGLSLLAAACGSPQDDAFVVPPELVRVWVTDHPRYADRAFEIDREFVYFQTGPRSFTVHRIVDFERGEGASSRRRTITYRMDGDDTMTLVLEDAGPGRVLFPNQRDVEWRAARTDRALPWSEASG